MKHVALILVLASLISAATYNNTLSGSQTAAPEAEGIALNLTAAGDLPGMTKVNLHRNGESVTSGSLRLTVLPQNANGDVRRRHAQHHSQHREPFAVNRRPRTQFLICVHPRKSAAP